MLYGSTHSLRADPNVGTTAGSLPEVKAIDSQASMYAEAMSYPGQLSASYYTTLDGSSYIEVTLLPE